MDGDNEKSAFSEEDEDVRSQYRNFIQLPLLIEHREILHKFHNSTTNYLEKWSEESFVKRQHSHLQCQIPVTAKTTYLFAFSPDGTLVASSHGDHNIYVSEVKTGKCICTLKGHPRSPWCVAFHPSSNEIIASGCLGGEVRVWDLKGRSEIWTPNKKCVTNKRSVIASLAFHPVEQLLVIATENELYFWDWFSPEPFTSISTNTKLEKIKYVEFDPLGYKLITGIAIVRSDRPFLDIAQRGSLANDENVDFESNSSEGQNPSATTENSDVISSSSRSLRAVSNATNRLFRLLNHVMRRTSAYGAPSSSPPSVEDVAAVEPGLSTSADPSLLPDSQNNFSGSSFSTRRHYLLPRSGTLTIEDDSRSIHRIMSEDSTSSSSLDSGSSVTSGVSGASNERDTRLSLLWTSRINRNENDTNSGGLISESDGRNSEANDARSFTLFDSREEGVPPRNPAHITRERRLPISSLRNSSSNFGVHRRRTVSSSSALPEVPTGNLSEADDQPERNRVPLPARNAAGQGGRWMYYRGKKFALPSNPPRLSSFRQHKNSGGSRVSNRTQNIDEGSLGIDEDPLAIPGPSGVSSEPTLPPLTRPRSVNESSRFRRRIRSQNPSLLDPQYGVRLLSRHIEHMQSICRSLLIPRAHLELTRHWGEISQLQQIRSMLYDIQRQIRSLSLSVDQSVSEDFRALDESLNSTLVDPEPPLASELLWSRGGLTDQVELEVNIGTDDVDQYSYLPLMEENSSNQLELENSNQSSSEVASSSSLHSAPTGVHIYMDDEETEFNISSSSSLPRSLVRARSNAGSSRNSSSRIRPRRICRRLANRDLWCGIARRGSTSRQALNSPRVHSMTSLEDLRLARIRSLREARRDQRRNRLSHRGFESALAAENSSNLNPENQATSEEVNSSRSNSVTGSRVRHRHSSDWQRRLRSFMGESQRSSLSPVDDDHVDVDTISLQREEETGSFDPDLSSVSSGSIWNNSLSHSAVNRNDDQELTTDRNDIFSSEYRVPRMDNTDNGMLYDGLDSDDEVLDLAPERITRAGPPTTSLSSRIATMLAQQREARRRSLSLINDSLLSSSYMVEREHRMPLRPGGSIRSRLDLQRRSRRQFPFNPNSQILDSSVASQTDLDLNGNDSSLRPVYERLRSLRREIMTHHRNRMLRRASNPLVSGRDLAGATLDAIGSPEEVAQRNAYQRDRTESFRHMLQMMAERLTQMMVESFSNDLGGSNSFDIGRDGRSPLDSYNLRSRARARRGVNQVESLLAQNSELLNDELSSGLTSSLNSHVENLRLLVQLALHLIYQLLNFICNQNLSYEERPISRLPNPFRDDTASTSRYEPNNGSTDSSSLQDGSPSSNAFEMDIEPGLHNLTTLLETVQMASEELRNDAAVTSATANALDSSANNRSGIRQSRDATAAGPAFGQIDGTRLNGSTDSNINPLIETRGPPSIVSNSTTRMDFGFNLPNNNTDESSSRSADILPLMPSSTGSSATLVNNRSLHVEFPQLMRNITSRTDSNLHPPAMDLTGVFDSVRSSDDDDGAQFRTFGGIPLRLLGRQNAVDRQSPDFDDNSSSSVQPEGPPARRIAGTNRRYGGSTISASDRSFFWHSQQPRSQQRHQGSFRYMNTPPRSPTTAGVSSNLFNPQNSSDGPPERDQEPYMYFNYPYFSHYIATSRHIGGSLFDPYSPVLSNSNNSFYRIQAWDYKSFQICDIKNQKKNIVVEKCRIHFDASVSISGDGMMLAAVLPDAKILTRIGVYSLETKTLGQLLYLSSIGFNIVCVSISPKMTHLVVGISSHRLCVNHSEKQVIGRIYKLCPYSPQSQSQKGERQPGNLKFCGSVELPTDYRQSSLNCIRWIPVPGRGLVYGTNRGQLTIVQ